MSSFQPFSQRTFHYCDQMRFGYCKEYGENNTVNPKSFNETTLQCFTAFTSQCDWLESSGNFPHEQSVGETNFGGSFFYGDADSSGVGGNFVPGAIDDAQVVPDFDELIETITTDARKHPSSLPLSGGSVTNCRVVQERQLEKCCSRRRNSERDELEIYFPCVLTPIPVDRLYSTLNDDSTVFKFPASSSDFVSDNNVQRELSDIFSNLGCSNSKGIKHSLESFGNLAMISFPDSALVENDTVNSETHHNVDQRLNQFLEASKKTVKPERDAMRTEDQGYYQHTRPLGIPLIKTDKDHFSSLSPKSQSRFNFSTQLNASVNPDTTVKGQSHYSTELVSETKTSPHSVSFVVRSFIPPAVPKELDDYMPILTAESKIRKHLVSRNRSLQRQNYSIDQSDKSISFENALSLWKGEDTESNLSASFTLPAIEREDTESNLSASFTLPEIERGEDSESNLSASFTLPAIERGEDTESNLSASFKLPAIERMPQCASIESNERSLCLSKSKDRQKMRSHTETCDAKKIGCRKESSQTSKRRMSECGSRNAETRDIHNDMEKQRRTNMKTRFQNLRLVVPGLSGVPKASKIVILRKALEYIGALESESRELENVKQIERQRNIELLEKLQRITSS